MLKILLSPTQCQSHALLCQELHAMVMDSLTTAGYEVVVWQTDKDFDNAWCLLMIGVGRWGISEHGAMLRAAGERGIRRIFWQLETLPPPDLPDSLLVDLLLQRGPDRTTGLRRFLEGMAYQRLAKQCQDRAWNAYHLFDPRRFSLPFREARKLITMWQDHLIDEIIVSLGTRQEFLATRDVPSIFMPFGYHPILGQPLANTPRDLDVVFLGTIRQGRDRLLAQVQQTLAEAGFQLTIVDKDCYGEERTRLLNRAKIVLYLRGCPWEMPRMRLLMAMGCRSMVLAETFQDTLPFRPGEHLVMSPQKELASTLITYLHNDRARQRIVDAAFSLLINDLGMEKCFIPAISAETPPRINFSGEHSL